jgi:hypothetical protein
MPAHTHRFTVHEYAGLATEYHTELIVELVYDVPTRTPAQAAASKLNTALARGLAQGYITQVRAPIATDGQDGREAPEPNIAIISRSFLSPTRIRPLTTSWF